MANQEHLAILKQGVEAWNKWREDTPDVQIELRSAELREANLHEADLWWTVLGDIDLSTVKGLETVKHYGPSTIGIDTLYRSQANIPEVFLKGAGVNDDFIAYIRSLSGKAIEYYSCFISYSSKDDELAKKLYTDLQSQNVRCWFAPEHLKWGERIRTGIDEAIRLHEKLLLILSKSSVASGWVEHELKQALAKERKEKKTILFPVRIDKAVFECPMIGPLRYVMSAILGTLLVGKTMIAYQVAFNRLLRDLRAASQ